MIPSPSSARKTAPFLESPQVQSELDLSLERVNRTGAGSIPSREFKRPFLKWAGSKFKILAEILDVIPPGNRLVEPFAGSGAVFLNAGFRENLVADANAHLIGTFLQVKTNVEEMLSEAERLFVPEGNTAEAFYRLREEFNADATPTARHAALFIYLNRHCFNGLCRFNRSGEFNVPFGRYRAPAVPRAEIRHFHILAQNAEFSTGDFLSTMRKARRGDVVYCDPPYAPLTPTANFTSYGKTDFGEADQRALLEAATELAARGIPVVISNHDTPLTRELYSKAKCRYISVQRYISCDSTNRAVAPEVVALFD